MMTHSTVDQTWAGFLGRLIPRRDDASFRTVHAGRSVLLTGVAGSIGSILARAIGQTCMRAFRLGNVLAPRGSVVPEFNPSDTLMVLLDSHYPRLVRA